ncbi:MAG: class I SAM-dependent methyltransferase [Planctomycetes bacterium]|nr:class I SAM-dependent methyltransferase [Planctomycetota bacterium]
MQPTFLTDEVTVATGIGSAETEAARRFGIKEATRDERRWQFVRAADGLHLCSPNSEGPMRLAVCGAQSRLGRRLRSTRVSDPLPRALGVGRKKKNPNLVDATAGICRDAMTLATLGCEVVAIERVPALALFAFLAVADAGLQDRVRVILGDATEWLGEHATGIDAVYLDPMFSVTGRAQVKKEMQACRALAGPDTDASSLLAVARTTATDRVVVKRHAHHEALARDVSFTVPGERIRFDVYLAAGQS